MIEARNLTKYYGRQLAIQELTFAAQPGEILGFLGPNGAGKTTTMRILTGYMAPSSGEARVAGFDVIDESIEARRRIGYLPETVPLYPEMSVYEYLSFMGSLRRLDDLDDRIEDVAEEVHLEDLLDRFIGGLSKGMRQRVGLAQALLHEPEVLILDEPTIGLDPGQIIEVRNLIKSVGSQRTVLLSTHILSEAQQVCNRVLIINRGSIVAEDSPENLRNQISGGRRVLVKARANADDLIEKLTSLEGVSAVLAGAGEGEVEVNCRPGEDPRPLIARAVVESGIDLIEMRAADYTLEDIFLELTRDAPSSGRESA